MRRLLLALALAAAFLLVPAPAQAAYTRATCGWTEGDNGAVRTCLRVWYQNLAGNDIRITRTRLCSSAGNGRDSGYHDMHNIDITRELRATGRNFHVHDNRDTRRWCKNDFHNTRFPGPARVKVNYTVGFSWWWDDREHLSIVAW